MADKSNLFRRIHLPAPMMFLGCLLAAGGAVEAEDLPPSIDHTPIAIAVHGQSIVVRAKVASVAHRVKTVTLFYTASRDAAPFRIPMQNSGAAAYTGAIPAELFAGLSRLFYYIEARDDLDAATETPWYTVEVKVLDAQAQAAAAASPTNGPPEKGRSRWLMPTLVAGGALLAGGAVTALAIRNKGTSSDSTSRNTSTNYVGTYRGTATTCYQEPASPTTCTSGGITITINRDLTVTSDDLKPGTHLQATLSGAYFVMTYTSTDSSRPTEIVYLGTLVDTRILGTIQGTADTSIGAATYSGNFNAVRQ